MDSNEKFWIAVILILTLFAGPYPYSIIIVVAALIFILATRKKWGQWQAKATMDAFLKSEQKRKEAGLPSPYPLVREMEFDKIAKADRELQFEVEDFLKECTYQELYDKLYPVLSQIKGFEHIMADVDSFVKNYKDIPPNVPKRALLALKGKLCSADCGHIYTPIYNEKWTHRRHAEMWKRNNEFMIWMDKELQKHGVEPMFYVDYMETGLIYDVTEYGVSPHSDAPVNSGCYYWKSYGCTRKSIFIQNCL